MKKAKNSRDRRRCELLDGPLSGSKVPDLAVCGLRGVIEGPS
jgi:hypothetical protein